MTLTPQGQFNACLSRAGEKTSYQDAARTMSDRDYSRLKCEHKSTESINLWRSIQSVLSFFDFIKIIQERIS
jgi:hypothetical protein